MPSLWSTTVEAHRRDVRNAILDAAFTLVVADGLRSVTMSRIAAKAGIGRATLYKYFAGVEEILIAWHERQVEHHLAYLAEVRDAEGDPAARLAAVLRTYALIAHQHGNSDLRVLTHQGEEFARAQRQLLELIHDLVAAAAEAHVIRTDVTPYELANYCLHSLAGASGVPSEDAVHRLVTVILDGLNPTRDS